MSFSLTRKISITWCTEDVLAIRPDLTDYEASDVLDHLKKEHDAMVGINWEVIDTVADMLFPKPDTAD